ncbi:endonuclease/exonuclease/phosphatase family protein [Microbulbifer sp. ANSA002]|uniref:endonuclease/exonuclease/phosphatase family protein n=1 Tax=unclassified Microbulbifer TaxID=2619833 RepID=UPI0040413B7B
MIRKICISLALLISYPASAADFEDVWDAITSCNWFEFIDDVDDTGSKDLDGYEYGDTSFEDANSGKFDMMVYNMDGFLQCIGGNSKSDFKQIIRTFNDDPKDLWLMQEVWSKTKANYLDDDDKLSNDTVPYRSKHWKGGGTSFGNGLLTFSKFPFDRDNRDDNDYSFATYEEETFDKCSGNDCDTEKGFTVANVEVTENYHVHIYNTHMDAGHQDADLNAKAKQLDQIADMIVSHSNNATVILAGDFNMAFDENDDGWRGVNYQTWKAFFEKTGGKHACQYMLSGNDTSLEACSDELQNDTDHVVIINNNPNYTLEVTDYFIGSATYSGLSDHDPVFVDFSWVKN